MPGAPAGNGAALAGPARVPQQPTGVRGIGVTPASAFDPPAAQLSDGSDGPVEGELSAPPPTSLGRAIPPRWASACGVLIL